MDLMPPSIVEDEPYAVDEGYLNNYCRLVTLMMFMPPVSGVECDMNVDIEIEFEGRPSDGAHP